jgi:hypothetical protein
MSSRTLPPVVLELARGRSQSRCVVLCLAASALGPALLVLWLGWAWTLGLCLMTSLLTALAFHRAGWLGASRHVARAIWRADGSWDLVGTQGQHVEARLAADTRMSPYALWLRWDVQPSLPSGRLPRRPAAMLMPSDLPGGDFRRLLVRLRVDGSECAPIAFENASQVPRT